MSDRDDDATREPEFEPPVEPPPLLTTLEHIAIEIDSARIDELWIFPPRRAAGVETAVIVLALRDISGPASVAGSETRRPALESAAGEIAPGGEDPGPSPSPSPGSSPARRRILTVHYTANRDRRGRLQVQHTSDEHGSAVPGRMGSVIEGVLRRMDESLPPRPPRHERLDGDPVRWSALLESIRRTPPRPSGDRA